MNPAQILWSNITSGEFMLVTGAVVVLVGVVIVNFWREIIVGVLAVWLLVHYFGGQDSDKASPPQDAHVPQVNSQGELARHEDEEETYLSECISLTQKPEVCREVVAQFSDYSK